MDWRQDKDYLDYIDSGESAAVYIVKNIVKSLDTKNMWVDVVSINTYYKRGSGNIAFNWIVVELFPRKIKPKYDTDPDYNRYLTWLTAHEDIEKQRDSGFHGEKFLVLCDLYDKNKNKFTTHTVIAKKYWEPMEAYRPMEIKNPVDPEWEYRVRAVKTISYAVPQIWYRMFWIPIRNFMGNRSVSLSGMERTCTWGGRMRRRSVSKMKMYI